VGEQMEICIDGWGVGVKPDLRDYLVQSKKYLIVKFFFSYFLYILRHTSTISYLNGNKDLDHIFDSLADRYQP
jgi:hypothetical protein